MSNFNLPSVSNSLRSTPAPPAQPLRLNSLQPAQTSAQTPTLQAQDQRVSQALGQGPAQTAIPFVESPEAPSAAEIKWAQELEASIKKGHQPTQAEKTTYQGIADRLEAVSPALKPESEPASERECQWAVDFEQRVAQGAPISERELASYRNIAVRLLRADRPQPGQGQATGQEMEWANLLQQRVQKFGYQPSQSQLEAYTDIYNRSKLPADKPKVSMQDLVWAQDLQQRVSQGFQPSKADQERYAQIYEASQTPDSERVSAQEIRWNLEMDQKVAEGHQPTEPELERYGDIAERLALQDPSSIQPQERFVSEHELAWAARLQASAKAGIAPSEAELERYQAIHARHAH